MTACVVDDLELVEIEKHEGMLARGMGQLAERIPKADFEFATVDDSCQDVVRCLPGQTRDKFSFAGQVVKNQHRPCCFAVRAPRRSDDRYSHRAGIAPDKKLTV